MAAVNAAVSIPKFSNVGNGYASAHWDPREERRRRRRKSAAVQSRVPSPSGSQAKPDSGVNSGELLSALL